MELAEAQERLRHSRDLFNKIASTINPLLDTPNEFDLNRLNFIVCGKGDNTTTKQERVVYCPTASAPIHVPHPPIYGVYPSWMELKDAWDTVVSHYKQKRQHV